MRLTADLNNFMKWAIIANELAFSLTIGRNEMMAGSWRRGKEDFEAHVQHPAQDAQDRPLETNNTYNT